MPRTGAQLLLGKGDFVVVARGESMRVQGPYASEHEMRRVVAKLGEARKQTPGWSERVKGLTRRLAEALPAAAGAAQQALLFSTTK
jgi:DNA segregation ATPase FtsK/SpoIIIE-like protein